MAVGSTPPSMSEMKRNWDNIRYKEALESCRFFNSRLLRDRAMRLPYMDSHTGIVQVQQFQLTEIQRKPSSHPDQVYSYPNRKWVCKRRPDFDTLCPNDPPERPQTPEHTALDEILARNLQYQFSHLANNPQSEESDDEEYGKRKRKMPGRRKRKQVNGLGF